MMTTPTLMILRLPHSLEIDEEALITRPLDATMIVMNGTWIDKPRGQIIDEFALQISWSLASSHLEHQALTCVDQYHFFRAAGCRFRRGAAVSPERRNRLVSTRVKRQHGETG